MNISIPDLSLVVLVGPSGCGKTTFAARHFLPTEVLSSDACRGWVSDDPNHQAATKDAFEVLHYIAGKRLAAGRLTVVDATSVQPEARRPLVRLAKEHHVLPVAIVLNLPEKICSARNQDRPDRQFGPRVIRHQRSQLQRSLRGLRREGFRQVHVLDEPEAIDQVQLTRTPLWCDRRNECGPFDVIGDVHGCGDELESLLGLLGYESQPIAKEPGWLPISYAHPDGRRAVFVGDLVDRGPRCLAVLSIVRNMMRDNNALCVPGNHDEKLLRWLRGRKVKVAYGLAETIAQIDAVPVDEQETFKAQLIEFLDGLVSHCVLAGGKLVVAHAGMPEHLQGRASGRVREFALYGEATGEIDEFGLPVRYNWAADYRGSAMVVYGHTPQPEAQWLNRTINVDTGCVFGGKLTALRYPEETLVSTPARQVYCESARPLHPQQGLTLQQQSDHLLDAADVLGKRIISTRLRNNITIREENAMAALEVMSRFAADPKWLIYLPPTMSPSSVDQSLEPTAGAPFAMEDLLETPQHVFDDYRRQGVSQLVCEEKHMGSRAVVVVCRDLDAARERFGVDGELGAIVTRTGRRFFADRQLERAMLERLSDAVDELDWWDRFETEWICLDCELMPWSAKAQELLRTQYAAVAAAGRASLPAALDALRRWRQREDVAAEEGAELLARLEASAGNVERFAQAYGHYCWSVDSLEDYRLAPFHLLATERAVHVGQDHPWHMETLGELCAVDPILQATAWREVDLNDSQSTLDAIQWWHALTAAGGEGMVVKPREFLGQAFQGSPGLGTPACPGESPSSPGLGTPACPGESPSSPGLGTPACPGESPSSPGLGTPACPGESPSCQQEGREAKGLLQPAIKCRGPEYLRIIYGPDYNAPRNLQRLRRRQVGRKQSLALREFALGVEALERFVRREPLRRVHECVFGVLALESEPVDSRL